MDNPYRYSDVSTQDVLNILDTYGTCTNDASGDYEIILLIYI